jgi:hypothetical protein
MSLIEDLSKNVKCELRQQRSWRKLVGAAKRRPTKDLIL